MSFKLKDISAEQTSLCIVYLLIVLQFTAYGAGYRRFFVETNVYRIGGLCFDFSVAKLTLIWVDIGMNASIMSLHALGTRK